MFYTIYQTTNTVNSKIYIGFHVTEKPDDGYLGSGRMINRAIKKYGRDAFTKKVLFVFDNPEEMVAKEKELVTEEFVLRDDTYNILPGGEGGWWLVNKARTAQENSSWGKRGADALALRLATDPEYRATHIARAKRNLAAIPADFKPPSFAGKKHSAAAKAKMSAGRPSYHGERNPQFGKVWISRDGQLRMVPRDDLSSFVAQGWGAGKGGVKQKPRA